MKVRKIKKRLYKKIKQNKINFEKKLENYIKDYSDGFKQIKSYYRFLTSKD